MSILTIMLVVSLGSAAAHRIECSFIFPVWQVCRVIGGESSRDHFNNPASTIGPADGVITGPDSPGNSGGGKGHGKGHDKNK